MEAVQAAALHEGLEAPANLKVVDVALEDGSEDDSQDVRWQHDGVPYGCSYGRDGAGAGHALFNSDPAGRSDSSDRGVTYRLACVNDATSTDEGPPRSGALSEAECLEQLSSLPQAVVHVHVFTSSKSSLGQSNSLLLIFSVSAATCNVLVQGLKLFAGQLGELRPKELGLGTRVERLQQRDAAVGAVGGGNVVHRLPRLIRRVDARAVRDDEHAQRRLVVTLGRYVRRRPARLVAQRRVGAGGARDRASHR